MIKDILLSVSVPTYNRPDKFRRMLMGLLPQMTSETELVIRDDSPNDETKKVLDELVQQFNPPCKVSYFHGEKIGLDAANLFLLENSKGEYMWWFSDDDEFMSGAIEHSLRLVKKYPEITFIWANFQDGWNLAVDREEGFFKNGSEALEALSVNIGLLSTYIVRREKGLLGLGIAKKHVVGFSFASTCIVLFMLSEPGKLYFLRGPYILCHPTIPEEIKKTFGNDGGIKNYFFDVFGVDFYDIVIEFKDKFTRHSVRKILDNSFASLWRGMLVGWVGGWDTPKGKRWKMFKYYWSFPEFWIAMPLFLTPLWLNKLLYRGYKVLFANRKLRLGRKKEA